jgi:hypothetical protein
MALQASGTISISDIAAEADVSLNTVSLKNLSIDAGFAQPHAMSEFYGWSNSLVSNISIRRYVSGTNNRITITESTNPQSFETPYVIYQDFYNRYYNYYFDYEFYNRGSYSFVFTSTFASETVSRPAYYVEEAYPITGWFLSGTPYLNPNGLPVSLVSWS